MTPHTQSLHRPLAVLVALFLGLGSLGTAAGAALGAVGAASADAPPGYGHHHGDVDDPRLPRFGR